MNDNKIKVFTAFSGYDSQCLALNKLKEMYPDKFDYELVGWSEIDESAIQAHNLLFPNAKELNYGDISKVDWKKVPDFDLLTYSSPCFVAGTKVIVQSEIRKYDYKNIEDIEVGDLVLTHTGEFKKVTETMNRKYRGIIIEYTSSDEDRVACTPNHPFYCTQDRGKTYNWKEAQNIDLEKDFVLRFTQNYYDVRFRQYFNTGPDIIYNMPLPITQKYWYETEDEIIVYNLEVEDNHSYTANGFVVHNCTDFSIAGKMAGGEEGSGTRSSLLWECKRCITEKRPKYLLFENVTALVSGTFLPLFKQWCNTVHNLGYENFYQILNAKDYGIPQNRARIFMVSIRRDEKDDNVSYNFPNPKTDCKAVSDLLDENVSDDYYISDEKVRDWSADNEVRIQEYIEERN